MSALGITGVRGRAALASLLFALCGFVANAQVSPEEHAKHHPGQSAGATNSGMAGGEMGMVEGMGEMMKGMGAPAAKELYPALMSLPELTAEHRREIERSADERMRSGIQLMAKAFDALNVAASSNNYAAMQESMSLLREGIGQFDSGTAARRVLAEGKAPRDVALSWFKNEMNLRTAGASEEQHGDGRLSVFHLLTMIVLVVFAGAMLVMYFFKMRRATALFGRIDSEGGSPPPGSAPPLA